MTQDLTTRDMFQHLDTRLSRVEDDLRTFRSEVSARFDRLDETLLAFRSETGQHFGPGAQQTDQSISRFDQIDARFDQYDRLMLRLFIVTWITVLGSIWLKP